MPAQPTPTDAAPLLVGQFRFSFADESWEWSAESALIHGYPAAEMRPTTAQVMLYEHPDAHARISAALAQIRRTQGPMNTRHRIVDVQGRTREIISAEYDDVLPTRSACVQLLLTAHERMEPPIAS